MWFHMFYILQKLFSLSFVFLFVLSSREEMREQEKHCCPPTGWRTAMFLLRDSPCILLETVLLYCTEHRDKNSCLLSLSISFLVYLNKWWIFSLLFFFPLPAWWSERSFPFNYVSCVPLELPGVLKCSLRAISIAWLWLMLNFTNSFLLFFLSLWVSSWSTFILINLNGSVICIFLPPVLSFQVTHNIPQ